MSRKDHATEARDLLALAAGFETGSQHTPNYLAAALANAGLAIVDRLDTSNLINAYAVGAFPQSQPRYEELRAQITARLNSQLAQEK